MKSSFWTPYISDRTIHAICWTLIHSLWIGLIIALLSGLVISITRKSGAALRYNLLCGVLMLFTLSVGITFWIEMGAAEIEDGPFRIGQMIHAPNNHILIIPATTTPHLSLFSRIVFLLNEYSNVIFLAWLLLFVLKSLKMAGGLLYIQRIRNYKVHEVSEEFKHKIEMFAGQIGIRQAVRLVQSELVKVPVAVGWLKPMILLPMGILLQLSPEQLESILWHELAHIRRRDYLVNILQGLVESVFFFNPGLLWLSSLIRAEREACCDDIVLSRMHRKANYLEALLAFGNEDNSRISLAMGIGSGNQLYDRMKRMVDKENKRLSMAEKVVLIAGLVVLSAFTGLPKTTQNAMKRLVDVVIKKPAHTDTLKLKTKELDSATKQTGEFRQTEVISRDTLHYKMDTAIRFRSVLFKRSDSDLTNNDISAMTTAGRKYHFIIKDNKLVAAEVDGEKVKESDLPNYEYAVELIKSEVMAKRHFREQEHRYAKLRADGRFDKMHNDSIWYKVSPNGKFGKMHNDSIWYKVSPKFKPGSMDEMHFKLDAMRQRFHDDSISYLEQKDRALNVIADLVHDKAVADPASVKWFGLSNTEFLVNGQKQPDEMQQKYKAKYGIYEGNGLYYGPVQMHGKGVFIDADPTRPPMPPGSPRPPKAQHEPKSGYTQPKYMDTNAWKMRQLIKQQQAFAADQDKQRAKLVVEQQHFVEQENKKREQLIHEQEAFVADQNRKREQLMNQQQADQAKQREQITRQQQQYLSDQQQKMQQRARQFEEQYKGTRIQLQDIMANITDDLVSANVVKDKSDLVKFNLTNSALMVNGIKQPEELHEKLKAKYLEQPNYKFNPGFMTDPNFGLHYNAKNGNSGLGITSGPDSP